MAALTPAPAEAENASSAAPELADPIQAHVQRVLRSHLFARAETQRRLLEYLWLHRDETLSEYALATEALGRNRSFDSSIDASVRVHISRLRRKLKDYYLQEPGEPEMLVIPTGTHHLQVVVAPDVTAEPPAAVPEPAHVEEAGPAVNYRRRMWMCAAAAIVFAVAAAVLGAAKLLQRREAAQQAPPASAFWAAFLQGNAPIKILLPTPTFFNFSDHHNFRFRSTVVNDYAELSNDPEFVALTRGLGTPQLDSSYTVTWDTLAAIDMARYLDTLSRNPQRISFEVTRDSNMTVLEHSNVIAFGTHQTLQPMHQYLQAMNFSLTHDETAVLNNHPQPGESARYSVIEKSTDRVVRPSIIALLPGRAPGLKVLLLQSRDTAAIVSMLASAAGTNSIQQMLRTNGNPQFYEMVVETELESNRALRSWPLVVRAFRAGAPADTL